MKRGTGGLQEEAVDRSTVDKEVQPLRRLEQVRAAGQLEIENRVLPRVQKRQNPFAGAPPPSSTVGTLTLVPTVLKGQKAAALRGTRSIVAAR